MKHNKQKEGSGIGARILMFFFGMPFFAMGAFFCWMGAIQPLVLAISSGEWPQVPCQIVSSEVERHTSSEGDTFSIAITFSYVYQGREYVGSSYDFNDVNSSGRRGKAKVIEHYPAGAKRQCWVNPSDPEIAVLSRKAPGIVYFIIPFTTIFMLIGLGIMLTAAGLLPKSWSKRLRPSGHKRVNTEDAGHINLKASAGGRAGKFAGMLFLCLFWNGIVGIFVWQIGASFMAGDPEWFLVLFLMPFVVVGVGMIGGVVYYLLALFNPKPSLSVDEGSPRLGDTVNLNWQFLGNAKRLRKVQITLEGRERATYRRGTNSVTDESLFYKASLAELENYEDIVAGQLRFTLPRDLMHTFNSQNNMIQWRLCLQGNIERWPDVSDHYPMTIRPLKINDTH